MFMIGFNVSFGTAVCDPSDTGSCSEVYNYIHADSATFGDTGSGNYTEIQSDGSIIFHGDATVWNDLRVSANDLVVAGANPPVWSAFINNGSGTVGSAIRFDGINQYGNIPDYTALDVNTNGDLTFEIWAKPNSNNNQLIYRPGYYDIWIDNAGNVEASLMGGGYAISNNPVLNGAWNHIIVVYTQEGANTRITHYLNGQMNGEQVFNTVFSTSTETVNVGNYQNDYWFDGDFDELLVYNVPLTESQILERYAGGTGTFSYPSGITAATDIIAYYSFDDGIGSIATNESGTLGESYDMTLFNSPEWADGYIESDATLGTFLLKFDGTTSQEVFFTCQIPHDYKLGTDLKPHVHWSKTASTGSEVPVWAMEYTIQKLGGTFGNTSIISGSTPVFDGSGSYKHTLTPLPDIDGSSLDAVSSMIICRLFRDTGNVDDTLDGPVYLLEFDFHYEIDSVGSKELYVKY